MDKELLESLIKQHLSTYEIALKTEKSQTSIRYWLKKYDLKTHGKAGIKTEYNTHCKICNKETTKGKMYCSNSCKNKQHYINNSEKYKNIPNTSKRLRETFKTLALDYCGNKCKMCGYNKNYTALAFHHLDSDEKDFTIGGIRSKTLKEEHKKELDKCVTVCHNCHSILHHKLEKPLKQRSKQSQKAHEIRRKLIDAKGGKCQHCSVIGINDIFAFHHIDESTKLFNIDAKACNGYHIDRLQAEADKCLLLCHNCHSEHHNPECLL